MVVIVAFCSVSFAADGQYTENLIPKMTSNTAPSGVVSWGGLCFDDSPAWLAFDKNASAQQHSWGLQVNTGWLAYEFASPVIITKYTIQINTEDNANYDVSSLPKNWTFEAWNGTGWVILDTRSNVIDWTSGIKKDFTFNNSTSYKKYRINISSTVAGKSKAYVSLNIGELEMMGPATQTTPTTPPIVTGNSGLLEITMTNGAIKEYDLTAAELQNFVTWYDARANGTDKTYYIFIKKNNIKPFLSRKEYIAFDKISSFEVKEYTE